MYQHNPNQQQPGFDPQQAMHYQQQQQYGNVPPGFQPYMPPRGTKAKNYAVISLVLFIVGGLLHLFALIPYLGIIFGCIWFMFDVAALIFLILVIADL